MHVLLVAGRKFALTWLAGAVIGLACGLPGAAQTAPDKTLPIRGTVVSVDRDHGTIVLRYAPPGSQPTTSHAFALQNKNDILRLHAGAVIDAVADTTGTVWTLDNVNVESDKPIKDPAPTS
jgi:hypothetical protein